MHHGVQRQRSVNRIERERETAGAEGQRGSGKKYSNGKGNYKKLRGRKLGGRSIVSLALRPRHAIMARPDEEGADQTT